MLDANDPYPRKKATVDGLRMAYVEAGSGAPIVFLHGNPTHSYIWRNVIPHLEPLGRCIAPDLIGMGASDKLPQSGPDRYTYREQRKFLFGLLDRLYLGDDVTLVLHDWGGALGFDWARHNPDRVRGIAFLEPMMKPLTWATMPKPAVPAFQGFRAEGVGETMCLEENVFVEEVIPSSVLRSLGEVEMAAYRAPYPEAGEGRRPTLTWPRQIPIDGEPADVAAELDANCAFLAETPIPKLFVRGEPGMMIAGPVLEFCRSLPNLTEVAVPGAHYLQEDSADEIGLAVAGWLKAIA